MIQRRRGSEVEVLAKEEDQLSRVDPSLMTERQQLTFLLRTTSHEASQVTKEKAKDAAGCTVVVS
uniref:Uncharacterized protein n=1 Tax=Peronospora matthiolae TaxID=2874970 RepID=A0AAV1U9I4_9STRA